jgi:hypothetical protein
LLTAADLECPRKEHKPFARYSKYGMDPGMGYVYEYNSLGWRGEEYDPSKKWNIFIFGASDYHGTGVNNDDLFAMRLRDKIAKRDGISASDIGVLNFACGGSHALFTVQSVVEQCSRVKPTLVLFQVLDFPEWFRLLMAHFSKNPCSLVAANCILKGYEHKTAMWSILSAYMSIENFLKNKGIPYVGQILDYDQLCQNPALGAAFNNSIDQRLRFPHDLRDAEFDFEGEGCPGHAGAKGHSVWADTMLKEMPIPTFS